MPVDDSLLATLGLDRLIDAGPSASPRQGAVTGPALDAGIVLVPVAMIRGLHHVVDRERSGGWRGALKASGHASSQKIAADWERKLAAAGKPALAAMPLEACLALIERYFAVHGWGRLKLDLTDAADHGLVAARLEHSFFAAALPEVNDFVDAFPAGLLQGFFEHISGQALACEEIACARRGASHCTFVITAPERLAPVMPRLGREHAEAILALLRT